MSLTSQEDPIVEIHSGLLKGRNRHGVQSFFDIPYAAPPTGELRFAPPQSPIPWDGIRDAQRPGKAAPQLPGEGLTNRIPVPWDEDCLMLNVTTPNADNKKRPVYVWIHGGGYLSGQGAIPWYDGTSFAANHDIVTVSINYRLGALGFCNLASSFPQETTLTSSGLHGTMDQIAALEWVQENISVFGGDPEKVTIGGESAGAFSVCNLLASPVTDGLFHQAIAQSGAAHHIHNPEDSSAIANNFLAELDNPSLDELRSLPVSKILEAQHRVIDNDENRDFGVDAFYPSWGGEVLPLPPSELISESAGSHIPLLIGTNEDEMSLWGITSFDDETTERYIQRITKDSENFKSVYKKRLGEVEPGWLGCAISSDWVFRIPAVRVAESREVFDSKTFMYKFSWDSTAFGGQLGAAHALEIPFTFNVLDRPGVTLFIGDGPRPDSLARIMHDAWATFIKVGNPSTERLGEWPIYDSETRTVMNFDDECSLLFDPEAEERMLWHQLR